MGARRKYDFHWGRIWRWPEEAQPRFTGEETEATEEKRQQLLSHSAFSLLRETQQGAGCRVTGRVQTGQGAGETGARLLPPSPTRRLEGLISGSQVLIVSSQSKAPSFPRHALISPWQLQGETRRKWTFFS